MIEEADEIVTDADIYESLDRLGFSMSQNEGRLMLAELLLKAGAGFYNSHTEEQFMASFRMTKRDRTPNKKGRLFLCRMFYSHSNLRPIAYGYMGLFRRRA